MSISALASRKWTLPWMTSRRWYLAEHSGTSETFRLTRTLGHFGVESLQVIDCTGTLVTKLTTNKKYTRNARKLNSSSPNKKMSSKCKVSQTRETLTSTCYIPARVAICRRCRLPFWRCAWLPVTTTAREQLVPVARWRHQVAATVSRSHSICASVAIGTWSTFECYEVQNNLTFMKFANLENEYLHCCPEKRPKCFYNISYKTRTILMKFGEWFSE